MREFKYDVLAFRQQEKSPLQVAFVAHAGDVLSWTGVPRKSDELLSGYQRFRDDTRVDREIVPFFQNPQNCSPTAAILALRQQGSLGGCVLEPANVPAGTVVKATLTVTLDDEALSSDKIFQVALNYVETRLKADEGAGTEDEPTEAGDEEESEEESGESGSSINLGSVTLAKMGALLRDRTNWKNSHFRDAIADYVKPAFLIDGQHRLAAAAKLDPHGLPFMICGLYEADWQEQVFHFTVVNLKPRRIAPALITSIAGLSLTRTEQVGLQGRLQQAGIRMREVSVMSLVAYDERSPFCDLVDMAVSRRGGTANGRLGYGGMKRVALAWYEGKRSSLTNIAKVVFQTPSAKSALEQWRESNVWFEFFCWFWQTVQSQVPESLWTKNAGNHLFVAAHLWAFQEAVLAMLDGQMPSWWAVTPPIEDFEERLEHLKVKFLDVVRLGIGYFPKEMWQAEWAKASQDTTQGRQELVELFKRFVSEGQQHGLWKKWKSDNWFKS